MAKKMYDVEKLINSRGEAADLSEGTEHNKELKEVATSVINDVNKKLDEK